MKNFKKNILLGLAVVMTSASVAVADTVKGDETTGPEARVSVKKIDAENKKALIRVTNVSNQGAAVLRIKDPQGHVLYREVVKENNVQAKKYDFSSLPNGEYLVELTTKGGTITESLSMESGKTSAVYFKPAVQVEPGMVKIAFMNNVETPVSLKFYNEDGQVLYEENVASREAYSKGLNVSKLNAGQYSLAILGNNYVYSKSIEVK